MKAKVHNSTPEKYDKDRFALNLSTQHKKQFCQTQISKWAPNQFYFKALNKRDKICTRFN